MAQRTAFLNSDAKGYNKDFHHTWIHNYLLEQVGVMFSNYNTKPEFLLGDGQISGGKAIIRCTRTTGAFAGQKILVLFESTATENINTNGDKKVFIEIPEIYINDSTAITDTLTQGLNLGVGVIKSESDYPTHTNYIPLWEITGGDWAGAVDKRPEILAKGKPNSISYFDNNGVQRSMVLDSASLNKFLKSNGAGVAPSWADMSGTVEVPNLKNTFLAGEDILPESMFKIEGGLLIADVNKTLDLGKTSSNQRVAIGGLLNGENFNKIKIKIGGEGSPADNVSVRIETVGVGGAPSGTLIHPNAYKTITPSGFISEVEVTLTGNITGTSKGQKCAVVLARSGAVNSSNYFVVGVADSNTGIYKAQTYNGATWTVESGKKGYVSSAGFMSEAAIQAKATNEYLADVSGYAEAGATAGNEFTGIRTGMVNLGGMGANTPIYLTDTGELDTTRGTIKKQVGLGLVDGIVDLGSMAMSGGAGGGAVQYDAVIASDGSGDYTTIEDATADGKYKLFIKDGQYNITDGLTIISDEDVYLHGQSSTGVNINISKSALGDPLLYIVGSDAIGNPKTFSAKGLSINFYYTGGPSVETISSQYRNSVFENCVLRFYTSSGSLTHNVLNKTPRGHINFYNCDVYMKNVEGEDVGICQLYFRARTNFYGSRFVAEENTTGSVDMFYLYMLGNTYGCRYIIHKGSDDGSSLALSGVHTGDYVDLYGSSMGINGKTIGCDFYTNNQDPNISKDPGTLETVKIALQSGISIWKPSTSYSLNTVVVAPSGSTVWRCKSAHTSSSSADPSKRDPYRAYIRIEGVDEGSTFNMEGGWLLLCGESVYTGSFSGKGATMIGSTLVYDGGYSNTVMGNGFSRMSGVHINDNRGELRVVVSGDYNIIDVCKLRSQGNGVSNVIIKGNKNIVKNNVFTSYDHTPTISDSGTGNIKTDNILDGNVKSL